MDEAPPFTIHPPHLYVGVNSNSSLPISERRFSSDGGSPGSSVIHVIFFRGPFRIPSQRRWRCAMERNIFLASTSHVM